MHMLLFAIAVCISHFLRRDDATRLRSLFHFSLLGIKIMEVFRQALARYSSTPVEVVHVTT